MARIHDLFIVELAEVIKGYSNDPDVKDPFCLSEFYRFYELPNIAVSRENFEKMRPVEPERKHGKWIGGDGSYICSECNGSPMDFIDTMGASFDAYVETPMNYCPNCGADMRGEQDETD